MLKILVKHILARVLIDHAVEDGLGASVQIALQASVLGHQLLCLYVEVAVGQLARLVSDRYLVD